MAKSSRAAPLSRAQLEIMDVIWGGGEMGVADVWKELSGRRKVARNTVQTTLVRLEEKGWLKHRVEGNGFLYRAAVPREATLKRMLKQLVDSAFSGSVSGLVMTLLDGHSLTKAEAERIRAMIRQSERDQQ